MNNGTYDITATLDHYTSVGFEDVEVIANDTTSIDFTLLPWEIIPGTQFAMIEYITASLDGKYVQNVGSNKVGAFGSGGTTDCRGIATWQEGNHPLWKGCYPLEGYWYMTIVSDYNAGNDTINFKLYDTETDSIYDCYETIIFVDCDTAQVDIIAQNEVDQNFSFTENWNWISFNVHPANTSISSVFDPIKAEMVQVKNQSTSATYFDPPGTWQGELTNITDAEGYLLYTPTSVSSYTLFGYRINPETHPIVLTTGCNWIGYLPNEELELDDAVQCLSVLDSLVYIKTQQKSAVYYNGGWVGDLLTMKPGVGYKIKTLAAKDTLTYPIVESSKGTSVVAHTNNPLGWKVLSGCAQNMIAIVNPKNLQDPSTLSMGVFDEYGTCYSIGSYTNDVWYFTIVGQDIHELHFEAYHTENGAYYTSSEKFSFQNDNILGKVSEPYEITLEKIQHNVPIIELKQNTPNPFKSSTSIQYYIPEPSHVEISVYNILGQKVTTLLSTHKESGEYVLTWNGLDENGTRLSSGIYFYKLMTDSFSNVKKMLIIQ